MYFYGLVCHKYGLGSGLLSSGITPTRTDPHDSDAAPYDTFIETKR